MNSCGQQADRRGFSYQRYRRHILDAVRGPLLAFSGHRLVHRTCLHLNQSGHRAQKR